MRFRCSPNTESHELTMPVNYLALAKQNLTADQYSLFYNEYQE